MNKPGERVGAISRIVDGVAYIYGFGVYEGDFVPEPGITFMGINMNKAGHKNPRIKLDSGKVVYGCECWWGPEAAVKAKIEGLKIMDADIEADRVRHTS